MPSTLHSFLLAQGYYPIALNKSTTNHFLIKGKVNGYSVNFVLDTGASGSCLDGHRVEKLGLTTEASDEKATGLGISEMEKSEVLIEELLLSIFHKTNYTMAVIDLSHVNYALENAALERIDGIIGADFMMEYQAVIDYKTEQMYLKEPVTSS